MTYLELLQAEKAGLSGQGLGLTPGLAIPKSTYGTSGNVNLGIYGLGNETGGRNISGGFGTTTPGAKSSFSPDSEGGLGLSGLDAAKLGLTGLGMALNYSPNKRLTEAKTEGLVAGAASNRAKTDLLKQDLERKQYNFDTLRGLGR